MTDFAHTIGFMVLDNCFVYDVCNDVFDEEPGCRIKPSVLIIGADPVGLTAAAFLTHYGIPVRFIDKKLEATQWVLACAGYHSVLCDDCHVPYVGEGLQFKFIMIDAPLEWDHSLDPMAISVV